MIEKKYTVTDRAWEHLYQRLNRDGLLSGKEEATAHPSFRPATFRWAVCAAVLLIGSLSGWLLIHHDARKPAWMVVHNDRNASTLVTMLEDSSIVYLLGEASIQYPGSFGDGKREIKLKGDAFFEVSRNPGRPFLIDTKPAAIEVLGTAFDVRSDRSSFLLSVRKGEVKVSLKKNDRAVYVKAGEAISLEAGSLRPVDAGTIPSGKHLKQIYFKGERLGNVVHIINTNLDTVRLEVEPGLEGRLLTAAFAEETPQTMAELICMALNLQHVQRQDTILIFEPKE
ncbi:MAG: FecR domain-containing protein [Tannerella sp.]|jgi:ferric-dicitrate binding protein FerR (iron transport regulator)|nr:FecR domain-containing protein [Tannerella sp.]